MSITSALYASISGLQAMSKNMQVISNDIANVNTVGYKSSRSEFADLLSMSINTPGGSSQLGRGVRLESVQTILTQGSFESTSVETDCAINGTGWFVVSDGTADYYTRAGAFTIDSDGYLVNSSGLYVQGYTYDSTGTTLSSAMGNIALTSSTSPANPTTTITADVNLDSDSEVLSATGFDITDADATSNFSTTVTLYDSLGAEHTATVYFTKTADNEWSYNVAVDGGDLAGGTSGTAQVCETGTLSFNSDGTLASQTTTSSTGYSFTNGATASQAVTFDFSGSTQTSSDSAATSITQDGYASGTLTAIDIDTSGNIVGTFSNGVTRNVAALTVASFASEAGLDSVGSNLYISTPDSGEAVYGTADTGSLGTVASCTLELSNVDLTEELTEMITTQRAYQSDAKVVTTGDEMLQTVIEMKR
ncbi:TPA: flagellar hook protein FlgE [Candidatus Sumerlaeota bacterium]|jgi:flagellar hook protein FlgE|nr:flagellar hook protein FlgE [Candidatus Sumerlaeota bacterium]